MSILLRGALVEYGLDLIGPIPNVVLFQFNPEQLTRNQVIPGRAEGGGGEREQSQAASVTTFETITFKASFDAADLLDEDWPLARAFGIGPQLAALEKMVYPMTTLSGLLGQAIDAIGGALGLGGGGEDAPTRAIPREEVPRILFIWGIGRILPVAVTSMQIVETEFDFLLNPTKADVEITLAVRQPDPCSSDWLAKGALEYTKGFKEAQAIANLATSAKQVVEIFDF